MTAFNIADHFWEKALDRPGGKPGFPRMFTPHRRPYATTDGHICLLAVTNDQWTRLLPALGLDQAAQDPRFKTLEGRTENINELLGLVAERLATNTTKHWRSILDSVDIPNGTMASLEGLFEDPYLNMTGFFKRLNHPTAGPTLTSTPPIAFFKTPANIHRPQPVLGADGRAILEEVGLDASEIDEALG